MMNYDDILTITLTIWFVIVVCLYTISLIGDTHGEQLYNPYWPFSVETSIKDR